MKKISKVLWFSVLVLGCGRMEESVGTFDDGSATMKSAPETREDKLPECVLGLYRNGNPPAVGCAGSDQPQG